MKAILIQINASKFHENLQKYSEESEVYEIVKKFERKKIFSSYSLRTVQYRGLLWLKWLKSANLGKIYSFKMSLRLYCTIFFFLTNYYAVRQCAVSDFSRKRARSVFLKKLYFSVKYQSVTIAFLLTFSASDASFSGKKGSQF